MHQTLYIDIDEEITSIVEKIRKTQANEVVIVVPKRALLIQSIVNLRILKKEAESLERSIMIVTQDKLGKILIEKAGILVQKSMEDFAGEEIISSEKENMPLVRPVLASVQENPVVSRDDRTAKIGSDNYFDDPNEIPIRVNENVPKSVRKIRAVKSTLAEKLTNTELVTDISHDLKHGDASLSIDSMRSTDAAAPKVLFPPIQNNFESSPIRSGRNFPKKSAVANGNKIEQFFQHNDYKIENSENTAHKKTAGVSRGIKKFFLAFTVIAVLVITGVSGYLFVPKATIEVFTKKKVKMADTEIKGDVNITQIDYENEIIPAKAVATTISLKRKFDTTGAKSVSNQKAHGAITIYNEFSSSSQPLVATTRFVSEDGKLFRLTKGITVPGTTKVGSEVKPGAIEAEIAADEPGESYNIDPTKFTIPGFKESGTGKYDKIYAMSTKAISGGGNGNGKTKALSEDDIAQAKNKIVSELPAEAKTGIKKEAGGGLVVLDEAIAGEEAVYTVSNSSGEVVDSFEITAQEKVSAIVFSEEDLRGTVGRTIARSGDGKMSLDSSSVSLEYGKPDVDFKLGTIQIKVHGVSTISPNIDTENLKLGSLGKTNSELEAYLGSYPDIEKVEITYWPPFINGKIPTWERRVEVLIDPQN